MTNAADWKSGVVFGADQIKDAIETALLEVVAHLQREEHARYSRILEIHDRCEELFGYIFADIKQNIGAYIAKGIMSKPYTVHATHEEFDWILFNAEQLGLKCDPEAPTWRGRNVYPLTVSWEHLVVRALAERQVNRR